MLLNRVDFACVYLCLPVLAYVFKPIVFKNFTKFITKNEIYRCMKTENKVAAILFIMAFSTIFLLYAAISADTANNANDIPVIPTKNDIGKTVYVEGTVLSKRMTFTGNNLLISLDCQTPPENQNQNKNQNQNQNLNPNDSVVIIFIPRSSGAASFHQSIDVGNKIGVRGVVEEYNGTLEVVLKNEKNLFLLK